MEVRLITFLTKTTQFDTVEVYLRNGFVDRIYILNSGRRVTEFHKDRKFEKNDPDLRICAARIQANRAVLKYRFLNESGRNYDAVAHSLGSVPWSYQPQLRSCPLWRILHPNLDHNTTQQYAERHHNHDNRYARLGHHHNDVYSQLGHNHDSRYARLGHDHDDDYAEASHEHPPDIHEHPLPEVILIASVIKPKTS